MKKLIICVFAIIGTANALSAQKRASVKPTVKTSAPSVTKSVMKNLNDSFSYAAGMNIAASMKEQGIVKLNTALVQQGIQDIFKNGKFLLTKEQANLTLQKQLQICAMEKGNEQKVKGNAFLDANKSRKGVITLPSGLQYEILKAGETSGIKPTAADTVVVDYVGTLTDGTEFDNSIKNGQPATFPVGGVIKGWTEILQMMTKGAHWKVTIPGELAYGERGAGAAIPPNSVLVFEIMLKEIKPAVKQ